MTQAINAPQFHASDGVEDWRMLFDGAHAHFRTESYAEAVALVDAIGALAASAGLCPDVDLRPGGVGVGLTTRDRESLTETDLELARSISRAAQALGATADPTAVQVVDIALQTVTRETASPFWRAVLGYDERGPWDLIDYSGRLPTLALQPIDAARPERNTIHVDISVPHDVAEARVAAAVAAGGRLVTDAFAPAWWVLADPEGNEACIATWQGRD